MVDTNRVDRRVELDVEASLTRAKTLHFNRAARDASRLFVIEGVRNFIRTSDNRFEFETIIYSEKLLVAPIARKLVRHYRREGVPTLNITPERFREISHTESASGIAAIVRQRWAKLSQISPDRGLCWIALESVRSPGNLGTLIRTSEAVGGAGFILLGNRIDPYAPEVLRASMTGIFDQQFVRANFPQFSDWLKRHRCEVVGASPAGERDLHQFIYPRATVLFLGEERQGLTDRQRDLCHHLVRIPMVGAADSLNLGVAGSLFLYELYRDRAGNPTQNSASSGNARAATFQSNIDDRSIHLQ